MKYKCIIFDLDGTIYFGKELAEKANEVIKRARKISKKIFFVTNNSAKSRKQIFDKLKNLGIDLDLEELYTVSYIMPKYLQNNGYKKVYCIGTEKLKLEIENLGIVACSDKPEAVVVGFNPDFKLHDLDDLANISLSKDCKLIIANRERTYPVDNGFKNAGAGPIVASVENLLNHSADVVVGKPNSKMIETVVSGLGIKPNEICVVGDSYNSDIKMAQAYGADSILISNEKKDDCICIEKLSDLLEMWDD